jgi:uncharacterized protein (DUF927 family)
VFFSKQNKNGELQPYWICAPLRVLAMTRDGNSGQWGRLLHWSDADGVEHEWAMPAELLQGDGTEVRAELARLGLAISPNRTSRERLSAYVQVWPTDQRARCVDRLGWHGPVYISPLGTVGHMTERVVFQNPHAIDPAFSVSGTVEGWRSNVGALAAGNSRLVLATSIAFAGPLPSLIGDESGGFHLRGGSSSGKTTALKVAASVWGHPDDYPRSWRATTNGLEALAALHSDNVLILDELSQISPREAGEAAYLLANGRGKARASRNGTARRSARWRLLFLSAGEESLALVMAKNGKEANVGQEIRLADIEADAGAGYGVFECLHQHDSAGAFAVALRDGATLHHGAVGMQWLRHLVTDKPRLPEVINDAMRQFVEEVIPKGAEGQVVRVARRFGLVAAAGELATHFDLTGWAEGDANDAATRCFSTWLESFGGAENREDHRILAQVRAFFEAHGASRFQRMDIDDERVINRAGFVRKEENEREYLVLPEAFKNEVCRGVNPAKAAKVLVKNGWLQKDSQGKNTQRPRLPGLGLTRCYVFTNRMWNDECD